MTTESKSRTATITFRTGTEAHAELARVERYLPENFFAYVSAERIVITGEDAAGWTMEGYVIPRLASGMIFARLVSDETLDRGI